MPESKPSTAKTTAKKTQAQGKAGAVKRSTAGQKAARTRSARQAGAAIKATAAGQKADEALSAARKAEQKLEDLTSVERVQRAAERAVLVPLGATLVARDSARETAGSLRQTFASTDSLTREIELRRKRVQAEVKRFERRGASARTQLERDLTARRRRIEKDVRARRTRIEQVTGEWTSQLRSVRGEISANADLAGARAENLVQTGLNRGQHVVTRVTERVAAAL